jgi:hypothetical protein
VVGSSSRSGKKMSCVLYLHASMSIRNGFDVDSTFDVAVDEKSVVSLFRYWVVLCACRTDGLRWHFPFSG